MAMDATSRHLRSGTELQLLVPVRQGFVVGAERQTLYARRLKLLLEVLTESIRVSWDRDRLLPTGPIDQLRSILSTQWSVQERDQGGQLVVAACFDRSWEEYFHLLVDRTGPLLDAIFMHCDGFAERTCKDGYEPFARFIRDNQLRSSFFYMTAPDLTVDDLRRARKMLGSGHPLEAPLGTLEQESKLVLGQRLAEDPTLQKRLADSLRTAVTKLYAFRRLFPSTELFPDRKLFPDVPDEKRRTAQRIFDEAVANLLDEQLGLGLLDGLPDELGAWVSAPDTGLKAIREARRAAAKAALDKGLARVVLNSDHLQNIQGNILESYAPTRKDVTHGCMVLIQCDTPEAARALLGRLNVTTAEATPSPERAREGYLNVGLSNEGLRRLLPPAAYALLPKEFREGMTARLGLMGDVGSPDYGEFWRHPRINWPAPEAPAAAAPQEQVLLSSVDVVVIYQKLVDAGATEPFDAEWSRQHPLCKVIEDLKIHGDGARILHVQLLRRGAESHFKLSEDGGSQPVPNVLLQRACAEKDLTAGVPKRDWVPLGELLLGYPDNRGEVAAGAQREDDVLRDGSFLVVRKLAQHVEAFEQYTRRKDLHSGEDSDTVKAWLVGRHPNGDPLVSHGKLGKNDFDYAQDPGGKRCPLHSHIRRTNPRTPVAPGSTGSDITPRILRRSFAYGPDDNRAERGLMFMVYNASIASQFEVVQRWVNGANSTGLPSTQNDLLSGVPQPTGGAHKIWDGAQWQPLAAPASPFVSLKWGIYLFVPSVRALRKLASGADQAAEPAPRAAENAPDAGARTAPVTPLPGLKLVAALNALEPERARIAWKDVIEGDATPEKTALIWEALRSLPEPVFATNYGLLIATEAQARRVLTDQGGSFSVREYYPRLDATIGPHYLAYDPLQGGASGNAGVDAPFLANVGSGDYWQLSHAPNAYLLGTAARHPDLYARAYNAGHDVLSNTPTLPQIDLVRFLLVTLTTVGHQLVGIPGSLPDKVNLFRQFVTVSRYAFLPYPDEVLTRAATAGKADLLSAYRDHQAAQDPLPMLDHLLGQGVSKEAAIVATIGALVGFAAPALAAVLNAFSVLATTGELQRTQVRLSEAASRRDAMRLVSATLTEALVRAPATPILYRTALPGNPFNVRAGEKVILGLASIASSAAPENRAEWLFGGEHGSQAEAQFPHHGCPVRNPALMILGGLLELLLRLPNILRLTPTLIETSGPLPLKL